MKSISTIRSQNKCASWHGGQWSALYQFASSGIWLLENHLRYLEEIQQEIIAPETALKPFTRSQKDANELVTLKNYFIRIGEQNGIKTNYVKDGYGFEMPTLAEPNALVKSIKRLI